MPSWREEVEAAITDFLTVAKLARHPISRADLVIEYLDAPHKPAVRLPAGKMAVYGFCGAGGWLKIGKAGALSNARYASQHYSPGSARSTLAASLASDPQMLTVVGFDPETPGLWIKAATQRVNILMEASQPRELLSLLEAFLHLRLRPCYEG